MESAVPIQHHSQSSVTAQHTSELDCHMGSVSDSGATCQICMGIQKNSEQTCHGLVSHAHHGTVRKLYGHVFMQMQAFIQGFMFCKVVCALLDRNNSSASWKCESQSSVPPDESDNDTGINNLCISYPDPPYSLKSQSSGGTRSPTLAPVTDGHVVMPSRTVFKHGTRCSADNNPDAHKQRVPKIPKLSAVRKKGNRKDQIKLHNDMLTIQASDSERGNRKSSEENGREHDIDVRKLLADTSEIGKISLGSKTLKKKILVCRLCGKMCVGQAGLSVHTQNRHSGEKPVECEICAERFTCSRECERHRKKVHGKMEGVCHICGKHFRYKHALLAHIKAHTGIKGFICEQCGKSFVRMTTLCTHRKRAHCCRICQAELVSGQCPANSLHLQSKERRLSVLDSRKMLQCRECNQFLDSVQNLELHMKEHKLQRPYHCQVCGNGFHTLSSLSKHSKQHQEKLFKCSLCDKTFTYKCNMQKHLETHVQGRPFQCEFCSKTFKTKGVMERHVAMHVEERQYKCRECGKGLTRLQTLKNHMVKMHPDSKLGGITGNALGHLESEVCELDPLS